MSVHEAMIDAALTIRVWQREGLTASDIGSQMDCPHHWNAVENAIVIDLLLREDQSQPRLPLG